MLENQAIDFQKYIDQLNQDRKEAEKRSLAMEQRLMDDAREREQRSQEREQRSREERKSLEERLTANAVQMEERLNANAVKMEERLNANMTQLNVNSSKMEERINTNMAQFATSVVQMEERINTNAERIEGKIDNFVAETKESLRESRTANRWFIGFNIAALIGIAGIIITLINILINGNGM